MSFAQDIIEFNKKLEKLELIIKDIFKIKKDISISILNCSFKDEKIVIQHSDFPDIVLIESDLDDPNKIKENILNYIEYKKKEKRVYDIKWEIDYWIEHTNKEFIDEKLQYIELLKSELITLSNAVDVESIKIDYVERKERYIKLLKDRLIRLDPKVFESKETK